jgi:nitroreductase
MNVSEAMGARHSVRQYTAAPVEADKTEVLQKEVCLCNAEGDLHIQLMLDEPKAFGGLKAHYGKFSGVRNYFAMVGKKAKDLNGRVGYYGERLVLDAQMLGLNTCWVVLTYSKGGCPAEIGPDEELVCVIALGHGETEGVPHRSKAMEKLCKVDGDMPDWFRKGMEAAMLAPTAMNQQKFLFTLAPDGVRAEATGGFYSDIDLGIVRHDFEAGAGKDNFKWA